jgi:hypothetical protein
LTNKLEYLSVVGAHDVRSVRLVPSVRGVVSVMMTDRGAAVVEGRDEQGRVGGRWSFGPHIRVGRGVGIDLSRQWRVVRFTQGGRDRVGGWIGWRQSGEERVRGQLGVKLSRGALSVTGIRK